MDLNLTGLCTALLLVMHMVFKVLEIVFIWTSSRFFAAGHSYFIV